MDGDLIEVDEGGEVRRLGMLFQPRTSLRMNWPVYGGADYDSPPPLPRPQWYPVSLSALTPEINNQNGVGMCASSATVNVFETSCKAAGIEVPRLSAGDLYRRVCGGRDRGSLPEDNLMELIQNGIATVATCPYLDWRTDHAGAAAERLHHKGLEAWLCPTTGHVASALAGGFPVLIGYMHHNSDPVGSDGWMSRPAGRAGGHAVLCQSVVFRGSEVGFGFDNQWTPDWGMNGRAVLPESRVAEGCHLFQAWALRAVRMDGGNTPPPAGD